MLHDQTFVLGTAGHIDHGKTALVRALTGIDTDRLPAEKQRGITIDLGFAPLRLGTRVVSVVDVPGHERFIRNMLAGATGLDMALLVVAADDSVMPQTREHLEILEFLGIPAGVIAITKCDLASAEWLAMVEDDIRQLVAGTFLADAPIVRTSVTAGIGLDEVRRALEALCDSATPRDDPDLFRLAIDRAFTRAGHGTIVTGTVASGAVRVGDEVDLWPSGRRLRVRGLHRHDQAVDEVGRGARAALNLAGIHHAELVRGDVIAAPDYLATSRRVTASIRVSQAAPRPLRHRQRYKLHIGTVEVTARLDLLSGAEAAAGETALAQLWLDRPIAVVNSQPFVLREESPAATLGGGWILQPVAPRIRRRDHASQRRALALRAGDPADRLAAALASEGLEAPTTATLCRDSGLSPAQIEATLPQLYADARLVQLAVGPRRSVSIHAELVEELEQRVLRALTRMHNARPRQSGIRKSHVLSGLPGIGSDALILAIVERLKSKGALVADDRTYALATHRPRLSHGEQRLKDEVARAIQVGGYSPPDQADLLALAGNRAAVLTDLLALLCDEGRIVEIKTGLWLDADREAALRESVIARLREPAAEALTMADLRDMFETTRKYAVPFAEYLDRVGVTRRDGDTRVLAAEAFAPGL